MVSTPLKVPFIIAYGAGKMKYRGEKKKNTKKEEKRC